GSRLMRVLFLTLDVFDGGASRCVRELLDLLPARGVETEAWVARLGPTPHPRVQCFRLPAEKWWPPGMESFPGLFDWRHRGSIGGLGAPAPGGFDLVHMHVIKTGSAWFGALSELCGKVPTVWTLHEGGGPPGGFPYALRQLTSHGDMMRLMWGPRRWL